MLLPLVCALPVMLLTSETRSQPPQSLSLRIVKAGPEYPQRDQVGYAVGYETGQVYWFVLSASKPALLPQLAPDSYTIELLCPEYVSDYERSVAVGIGDHPTVAFHLSDTLQLLSPDIMLGPGSTMIISTDPCGLQDVLIPLLSKAQGRIATGRQVLSLVAEMSGVGKSDDLPLKTPVDLLMAQLVWMGHLARGREQVDHEHQVEKLLAGQIQEWSRGKGRPVVGKQEFRDKRNRYLLGVLAAMTETNELREGQTNTLTVRYFPSSEVFPTLNGDPYSVEVTPDTANLAHDYHVSIEARRGEPKQQVAPVAGQVEWTFALKPLHGFRECSDLGLVYRLLRGNEELIPKTSLPASVRLTLGTAPKWWEKTLAFLTGSGAFIGWIIATALGVLQILDLWEKRRKKRREKVRPIPASGT